MEITVEKNLVLAGSFLICATIMIRKSVVVMGGGAE
jgi:hypothetical protein